MMNTRKLIQSKKFNHKAFCILYSIFFGIAWFILKHGVEYTGKEVMIHNLVFMTLFTIIIIVILTLMFTELDIKNCEISTRL